MPVWLELAAAQEGDDITGQHFGLPDRVLGPLFAGQPGRRGAVPPVPAAPAGSPYSQVDRRFRPPGRESD
jgi:hypothetical protein